MDKGFDLGQGVAASVKVIGGDFRDDHRDGRGCVGASSQQDIEHRLLSSRSDKMRQQSGALLLLQEVNRWKHVLECKKALQTAFARVRNGGAVKNVSCCQTNNCLDWYQ